MSGLGAVSNILTVTSQPTPILPGARGRVAKVPFVVQLMEGVSNARSGSAGGVKENRQWCHAGSAARVNRGRDSSSHLSQSICRVTFRKVFLHGRQKEIIDENESCCTHNKEASDREPQALWHHTSNCSRSSLR